MFLRGGIDRRDLQVLDIDNRQELGIDLLEPHSFDQTSTVSNYIVGTVELVDNFNIFKLFFGERGLEVRVCKRILLKLVFRLSTPDLSYSNRVGPHDSTSRKNHFFLRSPHELDMPSINISLPLGCRVM